MDFEGIAWIGNVYERFETMCLEVEDAMYQDTVKYVENQVQTVGASVKKFYSDAVQDLASPSAKSREQLSDRTFSAYPYGDIGIYNKPNAIFKKGVVKTDEQITEDSEVIPVAKQDCKSVFSANPSRREGFGLCLEQNEDNGLYRYSSGKIKKTLTNCHIPSETSKSITLQSDNLSKLPSCRSERDSYGLTFEQHATTSVAVRGSGRGEISCSNNSPTDTPTSEPMALSAVDCSSSGGCIVLSAIDRSSSDTCKKGGAVSPTESCSSGNPEQHSGAASDVCLLPPGEDNLVLIENVHVLTESETEATEQFEELKVEDNCVLVDRDFFVVHDTAHKSRSYKKKIKKAFSSKRSEIKKEYEQLAVQHGHIDAGSRKECVGVSPLEPTRNAGTKELSTLDVCETDWELL